MAKKKRFKKIYSQGGLKTKEIWIDTETGVNYFYYEAGYFGGFTPLLDKDGKPLITSVNEKEEV
ncbi:MAG TPA: DUF6440 family protein [Erysipelotrichaceae bacterium]|jgi:hypothetical protein|nr:xylan 1,4-beta-xylosidase [Erysipelotrichia bacterium]HPX33082.1 DUF6440 family protein [Erysipelotrichaceae bacterium]HQA84362.1 DUF6440 family protein [Erysipelotrichaceae bacterium]